MRLNLPKQRDITTWNKVFAWLPVSIDGKLLWLEHFERRFVKNTHYDTDIYGTPYSEGSWEVRDTRRNV